MDIAVVSFVYVLFLKCLLCVCFILCWNAFGICIYVSIIVCIYIGVLEINGAFVEELSNYSNCERNSTMLKAMISGSDYRYDIQKEQISKVNTFN